MTKAKKPTRYQELGQRLQAWRAEKFRSGLALFREAKLSFSYDTYVDFERGKSLPSPEQVVELAECFEKDARIALLLWAKVQMPFAALDSVFDEEIRRLEPPATEVPIASEKASARTPGPSIDTTWVLGITDRDLMLEHPWLWDILDALSSVHPKTMRVDRLPLPESLGPTPPERVRCLRQVLQPWLQAKHLLLEGEDQLRVRLPHIYLPKTEEWEAVRRNNFTRAAEAVHAAHDEGLAPFYRFVFHHPLDEEQSARWKTRLQELEKEFAAEPLTMRSDDLERKQATHVLAVLYGRRKLRKE